MPKKSTNSRLEKKRKEIRERFDRALGKMPWRQAKKQRFKGPCDAEIQLADELATIAAQKEIEWEDAMDDAFAAAVARDICLNG